MIGRFAARFRDLPIRRKLRVIFILTTVIALALAGLGIVAADAVLFYNYLRADLATFVQIIGDNSTGALAFDDANAGAETLAALRARTHVQMGCLYQQSGTLLAKYTRPGYDGGCAPSNAEQIEYKDGVLVASHQIRLAERPLGSLVLRYDLDEMVDRTALFGGVVLAALLLSCAVTFLISSKLRALIAEPILEVAGAARAVSHSKDYTIRATKRSQDEVGTLADALNQMMEGIQSRDGNLQAALEDQRNALQKLEQLNAELHHSNAELARSNNDLARFAFIASHDLQEPLRMITAYSQLLVAECADTKTERANECVKYIVGGTTRMRELLGDLSAYTEIAGFVEQPLELVDLNLILEGVQQLLSIRIEESQTKLIVGRLPLLYAHQTRMASLFQNLIENAIKYRSPAQPQIRIGAGEEGKEFLFEIADNGIGIEKEYQEKIFVAFQRLHGKEVPGTGIGLAICQRVVEGYGGRIWVLVGLRRGFHVSVYSSEIDGGKGCVMIPTSKRAARLILVEDNPGDVSLFRWALDQAKVECELIVIHDGGAALDLIREENRSSAPNVPDLVILDLNLPKVGGKEVLAAMRSATAFANVRVVIWTSSSAMTDRAQLDPFQVTRYLVKPSELRDFTALGVEIGDLLKAR